MTAAPFDAPARPRLRPFKAFPIGNPPAGANWNYTFPFPMRLHSLVCRLTTSAAVANRFFQTAILEPGGGEITYGSDANAVAASSICDYVVGPHVQNGVGAGTGTGGQATHHMVNMPCGVVDRGYKLIVATLGIDVADQFSIITLWVEYDVNDPELWHSQEDI